MENVITLLPPFLISIILFLKTDIRILYTVKDRLVMGTIFLVYLQVYSS